MNQDFINETGNDNLQTQAFPLEIEFSKNDPLNMWENYHQESLDFTIEILADLYKAKNFVKAKLQIEKIDKLIDVMEVLKNQNLQIKEFQFWKNKIEKNDDELKNINEKFQSLEEFKINLAQNSLICFPLLKICDSYFRKNVLEHFQTIIRKIFSPKKSEEKKNKYIMKFQIYETKIKCYSEFIPIVSLYPLDDLFCKSREDKVWLEILKRCEEQELIPEQKMEKGVKGFGRMLDLVNAVYSNDLKRKNRSCNGIKMCFDLMKYFCLTKKAKNEADLFYSAPDPETAIKVWNIPDRTIAKHFFKLTNPCIKIANKIYVERTVPSITIDSILKEYEDGTINKIHKNQENMKEIEIEIVKDKTKLPSTDVYKRDKKKDLIKIRIMSNRVLQPLPITPISDVLFIHIHGGGFISMSSKSHQCYTRLISKICEFPVFSIDYRLAPTHPYPQGVDDVWQSYNWLLDHCYEYFGIDPKYVILTGDSAGGNLAISVVINAIKKNKRKPDGLFLFYPSLNSNTKSFSPSYLKAFNDVVLQYTFIKLCLKSYVNDPRLRPDIDPTLSPLILSDEILTEFPPVQIVSGGRDPLSDDSLRFMDKFIKLQMPIKMKLYKSLPHGFMNYDYVGGLSPASLAINDSCFMIREFVKSIMEEKRKKEEAKAAE